MSLGGRVRGGVRARALRVRGRLVGTLTRVRTARPEVALTFDDGPDPERTPRLLEILERHGARATFFMIGEHAEKHPELVRHVAEAGHAIANHTWDHRPMPELNAAQQRDQLRRCHEATRPWGSKLFRPPRSLQTVQSYLTTRHEGYTVVGWTANVEDWLPREADWFAARLRERTRPGAILLLHDTLRGPMSEVCLDRGPIFSALEQVLGEMTDEYAFVNLPALVSGGRPVLEPWFVRTDDDW